MQTDQKMRKMQQLEKSSSFQAEWFPSADSSKSQPLLMGHGSMRKCVPCEIKGLGNHFMACEIYGFRTNACHSLGLQLFWRPKQTTLKIWFKRKTQISP